MQIDAKHFVHIHSLVGTRVHSLALALPGAKFKARFECDDNQKKKKKQQEREREEAAEVEAEEEEEAETRSNENSQRRQRRRRFYLINISRKTQAKANSIYTTE